MPSSEGFEELYLVRGYPRKLFQQFPSRLAVCLAKIPFPLPDPGTESYEHDEQICSVVMEDRSRPELLLQILT